VIGQSKQLVLSVPILRLVCVAGLMATWLCGGNAAAQFPFPPEGGPINSPPVGGVSGAPVSEGPLILAPASPAVVASPNGYTMGWEADNVSSQRSVDQGHQVQ